MPYNNRIDAYNAYTGKAPPKRKPHISMQQEEIIALIYDKRLKISITDLLPQLSFKISRATLKVRLEELVGMGIIEKWLNHGMLLLDITNNTPPYFIPKMWEIGEKYRQKLIDHALTNTDIQDIINELLSKLSGTIVTIVFTDKIQASKEICSNLGAKISSKLDFYIKVVNKLVEKKLYDPLNGYPILLIRSFPTKYGLEKKVQIRPRITALIAKKGNTVDAVLQEIL